MSPSIISDINSLTNMLLSVTAHDDLSRYIRHAVDYGCILEV